MTVFFTREGYFKKIPPQGLRTAGAHKLKEGDEIVQQIETRNNVEALFFTDKQQVYKVRLAENSATTLLRGRERALHGDHQRLQRLYAVLLCQRQVR